MATSQQPPETPFGAALYEELLWVHGLIRADLETVEGLAAAVLDGLPAGELREALEELERTGPIWQLRVSCLRYCRFVHLHHRLEDRALFPALRRTDPAIGGVVDRLEAEHRAVSDLLDRVEAEAAALDGDPGARARVAAALRDLAGHLLAHLAYEEEHAGPTLRRMQGL